MSRRRRHQSWAVWSQSLVSANGWSKKWKWPIGVVTLQYKNKTLSPLWLEQFDLYMYDDQTNQLEITVFDHDVSGRDDFMGR